MEQGAVQDQRCCCFLCDVAGGGRDDAQDKNEAAQQLQGGRCTESISILLNIGSLYKHREPAPTAPAQVFDPSQRVSTSGPIPAVICSPRRERTDAPPYTSTIFSLLFPHPPLSPNSNLSSLVHLHLHLPRRSLPCRRRACWACTCSCHCTSADSVEPSPPALPFSLASDACPGQPTSRSTTASRPQTQQQGNPSVYHLTLAAFSPPSPVASNSSRSPRTLPRCHGKRFLLTALAPASRRINSRPPALSPHHHLSSSARRDLHTDRLPEQHLCHHNLARSGMGGN
ncbi:hypothetical protein K402DRAFT_149060 [Aulographum hederae CBS 113979]|uniref:Uncharacterized protein n=1 Tax=Aulographum hederae CBS 113979 TaxID=1176131 RepID=A0A6G1GST3_9PEZI|nr:hypothetical protein K402DRAFT_149060 [Aulographum hederae CBS 113979]